jgi:hypothetical protein
MMRSRAGGAIFGAKAVVFSLSDFLPIHSANPRSRMKLELKSVFPLIAEDG